MENTMQMQINEMLKEMQDQRVAEQVSGQNTALPRKSKYNKYDFSSPRKFTKDKLKLLTGVFENYVRLISSQVSGIYRVTTEVTVNRVWESRYHDFVGVLHENDSMALAELVSEDMSKTKVPLLMYITPGFVLTLISNMLGGAGSPVTAEEGYRYSDVEAALYRKIAGQLISSLKDGFSTYVNLQFGIQQIWQNPSMFQDIGLDESVGIISLNVDMAGAAQEEIRICIPGTLLERIFKIMDGQRQTGKGYTYEDNKGTIMGHLRKGMLPMSAQLATVELSLNDIYHLHPGDIIDLGKAKETEVRLFVGKQPWFYGRMGICKKNMAIRISRRVGQGVQNAAADEDMDE